MSADKKKILIVDDEEALTELLKLNLEETGRYIVEVENKGSQAFRAAQAFRPDIILLDIVMPDKEGSEVAAQIKSDPMLRDTPIVFFTATVSSDEVGRFNGVIGGQPFLAKPVTIEQIEACVREHAR
ncbi:MAG: histidine kinase [Omnitrophica bacterium RIFCSPHIGHO2_02_FULL_51_18]|nr:MAG: histidine kinase [Omnitrophica bacterium RIFCSPHIGHO2_02_FULL_51_18]